jgi:alanyl-tRNA synthetase
MTERLDLTDPYLTTFDAEVTAVRTHAGRPAVVLSRTAFYPEGGGQPADTGWLGDVPVVDVQQVGDEVLHVVAAPVELGVVAGEIDWARRFDHMQQHHGQHLLSATFDKELGAATVSFHLGVETCTIDLAVPVARLGAEALHEVEEACNDVVFRDLPVTARDFAPDELARLPLRKQAVKGSRIVLVEGVDASPCGGTHPRRTGEVGVVSIVRAQKWGEAVARVEFVCGRRVPLALRRAREELAAAAEALRCAPGEVGAATRRVTDEGAAQRRELAKLEAALAAAEAERLDLASAPGPVTRVLGPDLASAGRVKLVAAALCARGRTALLAGVAEGRVSLCFQRPKGPGPSMSDILKATATALGGKGGGSPDLAQGSAPDGPGVAAALEGAVGRARD